MIQIISTVRRKKKKEKKRNKNTEKRKRKLIKIAIGILHTSYILSSIIGCLYVYINYFIFIIYHRHENWFLGLQISYYTQK